MSFNSQRIRRMRRLARDAEVRELEGLFVVLGPSLVYEGIGAGLEIVDFISTPWEPTAEASSSFTII